MWPLDASNPEDSLQSKHGQSRLFTKDLDTEAAERLTVRSGHDIRNIFDGIDDDQDNGPAHIEAKLCRHDNRAWGRNI